MSEEICLVVKNITKIFRVSRQRESVFRTISKTLRNRPAMGRLCILKNISFTIRQGEKVALIGENGSGKTTLLRILTGIYRPTSGEFFTAEKPRALFRFGVSFNRDLPLLDNIYLFAAIHGMPRRYINTRLNSIFEMSELGHLKYAFLRELSSGQLERIAFSVFFQVPEDFLIFDESLSSVDQYFLKKCDAYFNSLLNPQKTVLMASHDNSFLRKFCLSAIWIENGNIRMQGDINRVLDSYEESK